MFDTGWDEWFSSAEADIQENTAADDSAIDRMEFRDDEI